MRPWQNMQVRCVPLLHVCIDCNGSVMHIFDDNILFFHQYRHLRSY